MAQQIVLCCFIKIETSVKKHILTFLNNILAKNVVFSTEILPTGTYLILKVIESLHTAHRHVGSSTVYTLYQLSLG